MIDNETTAQPVKCHFCQVELDIVINYIKVDGIPEPVCDGCLKTQLMYDAIFGDLTSDFNRLDRFGFVPKD